MTARATARTVLVLFTALAALLPGRGGLLAPRVAAARDSARACDRPGPRCICRHPPATPDVLPLESTVCFPRFAGRSEPLPEAMAQRMRGVSWHEGCPVKLEDLALLRVPHWGFDGGRHEGRLVVARAAADDLLRVFRALYDARFPIERMIPVHELGGSDERSMQANNTSAFNCRRVVGVKRVSQHSLGLAVDVNPARNPRWFHGRVFPAGAERWLDRARVEPGMVVRDGVVARAFRNIGWRWGGLWRRWEDYQHFSADGT